jgi:hypothetical protein
MLSLARVQFGDMRKEIPKRRRRRRRGDWFVVTMRNQWGGKERVLCMCAWCQHSLREHSEEAHTQTKLVCTSVCVCIISTFYFLYPLTTKEKMTKTRVNPFEHKLVAARTRKDFEGVHWTLQTRNPKYERDCRRVGHHLALQNNRLCKENTERETCENTQPVSLLSLLSRVDGEREEKRTIRRVRIDASSDIHKSHVLVPKLNGPRLIAVLSQRHGSAWASVCVRVCVPPIPHYHHQ